MENNFLFLKWFAIARITVFACRARCGGSAATKIIYSRPGSTGIVKGIKAANRHDPKQMCLIQEYEMQGLPEAMEQQQQED